ncbi:hypothetical protein C9374_009045 [Naegleria lovaniensis]|uniref:Uncharacterized protein n=1 Tax=Naegleria lovaniensis TaxID=51637 RepID=A0AA88GDR0_NAELO|nr:uncharacterized protein C9374_009045 [Naegleria lovaniensis]KAG2377529.1 hypothetical protein C9374_009045 [Naegleria lovaniensis]
MSDWTDPLHYSSEERDEDVRKGRDLDQHPFKVKGMTDASKFVDQLDTTNTAKHGNRADYIYGGGKENYTSPEGDHDIKERLRTHVYRSVGDVGEVSDKPRLSTTSSKVNSHENQNK